MTRFLIVTLSLERATRIQKILSQYQQLAAGARIDWARIQKVSCWFGEIKGRWAQGTRTFNISDYDCVIVDANLPGDLQERVCRLTQRLGVYCVTVSDPEVLDWTDWSGQTGPLRDPLETDELIAAPLNTNALADAAYFAAEQNDRASRSVAPPMVLSLPDHIETGAFAHHVLPVPTTGDLNGSQQRAGAIGQNERYLVVDISVSRDTPGDAGHYLVYWGDCRGWLYRIGACDYQLHLRGVLPEALTHEQLQTVLSTATLVPVSMTTCTQSS